MTGSFWEYRVSPEECNRILNRAGLPPAVAIARIPRGEVNAVFDVSLVDGRRVIFKVQIRPGRPAEHLLREREACDLLRRATRVPVPEVLAVDVSREVLPYRYSLLTFLEGADAVDALGTLTLEDQRLVARSLGRRLAEVHGVTASAWPEPALPWRRSRAEWTAMVEEQFRDVVRKHRRRGFVPRPVLEQAEALWEEVRPRLGRGHFGLLHGDGHLANAKMSASTREIGGLFDFDQTDVGEAEFDLAPMETWRLDGWEECLREEFYDGYQGARPLAPGHEARVRGYTLLRYLRTLWAYQGPVQHEHGGGVNAEAVARLVTGR